MTAVQQTQVQTVMNRQLNMSSRYQSHKKAVHRTGTAKPPCFAGAFCTLSGSTYVVEKRVEQHSLFRLLATCMQAYTSEQKCLRPHKDYKRQIPKLWLWFELLPS